jgi:heat shock transcription factor, other eukaryote
LDDGKNTNLIRWSDDGNSFVVEDEDEFAKTLIPELFKHNNYASFVRQLNMYGFHKKVGLSDNSMRASEKKAKSPSEYSNPYFRCGHPDLLWLIQKPRNVGHNAKSKGLKRTEGDQNEDDVDDFVEEIQPAQPSRTRPRLAIGQGGATLPSEQLVSVHRELQTIRQQQTQITQMISRLKREHEQLYGQAANFQDQHSRHENSINAILTFLATVYNRSLQGHEGVQGIANLFTGAIPQESNQSHVVDVGNFTFDQMNGTEGSIQRPFKKQPLLLKAPPAGVGRASTASPSSMGSPCDGRQTRRMSNGTRNSVNQSSQVEEVFEMPKQQQTPQTTNQSARQPQNDILSVIHNTNARNSTPGTPATDFSNVLNSLESSGGGSPLTNTQRADMLRLINNQGPAPSAGENALTSPNPPPMPNSYDRRLAATKSDLDNLAKMQKDQDRSVQNLTNLLQPLSPSGSIPGIGDGTDVQPPSLNIDDFLNSSANYFTDFPAEQDLDFNGTEMNNVTTGANAINFADLCDGDDELFGNVASSSNGTDLGVAQNGNNDYAYLNVEGAADNVGGRVESMASSEGTSPTNTTGTMDGDGPTRSRANAAAEQQSGNSPARKRKRIG